MGSGRTPGRLQPILDRAVETAAAAVNSTDDSMATLRPNMFRTEHFLNKKDKVLCVLVEPNSEDAKKHLEDMSWKHFNMAERVKSTEFVTKLVKELQGLQQANVSLRNVEKRPRKDLQEKDNECAIAVRKVQLVMGSWHPFATES